MVRNMRQRVDARWLLTLPRFWFTACAPIRDVRGRVARRNAVLACWVTKL